ncbi:MAG: helix-turn-helix domain-containing protein [Candidatus Tectomicrobia bacterium]|nr:helix-turn-helix domain-containing protein [Candidatus Tectomicrobia bacterium]
MPETLLTAAEVAQHLRLHVETVYRLIQKASLPAVKVGGQWRFRVSEIDQWLRVQTEDEYKGA